MGLCPPCAAADAAWRDARPVPAPIKIMQIGSPSQAVQARRLHREDHYARVRWQRAHIAALCAQGRHVTPKENR
jgi:hypothetical protein